MYINTFHVFQLTNYDYTKIDFQMLIQYFRHQLVVDLVLHKSGIVLTISLILIIVFEVRDH
jgi:hypothetical protein